MHQNAAQMQQSTAITRTIAKNVVIMFQLNGVDGTRGILNVNMKKNEIKKYQNQPTMSRFEYVSQEIANNFNTVQQRLYLSDKIDNLVLVHYVDVDKTWKKVVPSSETQAYRGWIMNTKTKKIVARSFEWSKEVVISSPNEVNSSIVTIGQQGTILRAFWCEDKFYISTHRRISCEKSKWDNRVPYTKMISEAEERMNIKLENICKKGFCYVLLLVHPENQTVRSTMTVEPTIYHLDTWIEGEEENSHGVIQMKHTDEKDIGLPFFPFLSKAEIEAAYHKDIMLISKDRNGVTTKYIPKNLQRKMDIRGQYPNLYYCWFMWMYSKQQEDLYDIIPEYQHAEMSGFKARFETEKSDLCDFLYKCYTERCQNLAQSHYNLVKQLHFMYNEKKQLFSNKSNVERKFYWGKNKLETEKNIRRAIEAILVNSEPSSVYKAIVELKKIRHEEKKALIVE